MKLITHLMWALFLLFNIIFAPIYLWANQMTYRSAPKRLFHKPEVLIEWVEPLDDCDPEKVCV